MSNDLLVGYVLFILMLMSSLELSNWHFSSSVSVWNISGIQYNKFIRRENTDTNGRSDYNPRLTFKDDTSRIIDRMQEVSRTGSVVWDCWSSPQNILSWLSFSQCTRTWAEPRIAERFAAPIFSSGNRWRARNEGRVDATWKIFCDCESEKFRAFTGISWLEHISVGSDTRVVTARSNSGKWRLSLRNISYGGC